MLTAKTRMTMRLIAVLASVPVVAQVLHGPPACAAPAVAPAFQPTRFTVEVRGHGPDVILIPGLGSPREVWAATAARLEANHRVHLVQVAGFAGAPAAGNAGSGPVFAPAVEELHRYIQANGLMAPAVIGHSLGGFAGLLLAERHPEDVGRLMIVDSFPFFPAAFNPAATATSAEPQAAAMRDQTIAAAPEAFASMEQGMSARMSIQPQTREQIVKWAVASDRSVFARAFYEGMTTDARPGLAAVKVPVTVVYPYDPSMGAPAAALEPVYAGAYAALPGVKLRRIDGGYHFIMLDQPEAFGKEVDAFLQ